MADPLFPLELVSGDDYYPTVYNLWVAGGRPGTVEKLSLGWAYRAIWPDPTATTPTFTLIAASNLTDADHEGPPGGYSGAMATSQSSVPGGRRTLPK